MHGCQAGTLCVYIRQSTLACVIMQGFLRSETGAWVKQKLTNFCKHHIYAYVFRYALLCNGQFVSTFMSWVFPGCLGMQCHELKLITYIAVHIIYSIEDMLRMLYFMVSIILYHW